MQLPIKPLARLIARTIERGSARGAFLGALIGCVAGLGAGYLLVRLEVVTHLRAAAYIALPIACTIVAAMIGAKLGPAPPPDDITHGIRLTAYSDAAGQLVIALLLSAVTIGGFVVRDPPQAGVQQNSRVFLAVMAVCGTLALAAWLISLRIVWSIELGQWIAIRRLLSSRRYSLHNLRSWNFQPAEREATQRPFEGLATLSLVFDDDRTELITVDGRRSPAIIELLRVETARM